MGLYVVEDPVSGLSIGQAIYEVALIIAVLRWVLCLVSRLMKDRRTHSGCDNNNNNILALTTFGEIVERLPQKEDTCAVCLNELKMEEEVRELVNCYHVFHRECIDRWLEHEHEHEKQKPTCPLCRAPLLTSSSSSSDQCVAPPQPSWAVERLLYLFGDDLLPC
ncbi:hypothetical protein RJT34_32445 [Clitoria ternatea]|uniref:RING-type domain-containing protein n=1 Tax=Clitoria ternatea TaxID=43366 RepID=A0AAN9I2B1_CLITE